jgi:hypothetical protein
MSVALQFECGPTAYRKWIVEKALQRNDELLPTERTARTPVEAMCRLLQPAGFDIVIEKLPGIAMLLEPWGIDQDALGQFLFKPV